MAIKYDTEHAEKLISDMESFCENLDKEANALLDILDFSGRWNDSQMEQFSNSMQEIVQGVSEALTMQEEYKTFYEARVRELRE